MRKVEGPTRPHFSGPDRRAKRRTIHDDKPKLVDAEEDRKGTVLHAHDLSAGMLMAMPVRKEGDTYQMAREVCRFTLNVGVHEVQPYCENEPVMLQLQGVVQPARSQYQLPCGAGGGLIGWLFESY